MLLLYLVKGSCNVMFIDNEMDIFVIALCKLCNYLFMQSNKVQATKSLP